MQRSEHCLVFTDASISKRIALIYSCTKNTFTQDICLFYSLKYFHRIRSLVS